MLVASGAGLVGCSGNPKITKTFTPTETESHRSASPEAVAEYQPATETSSAKNVPVPKYPEAAKANTRAGQKAFIEYWLKTYNYAFETGDTKPLEAVSGKDCEFCANSISDVREMHQQKGLWRVGGGVVVRGGNLTFNSTADYDYIVDVPILDRNAKFYSSPGDEVDGLSRRDTKSEVRIWLERTREGFKLTELNSINEVARKSWTVI
jgi:hypothetical protein